MTLYLVWNPEIPQVYAVLQDRDVAAQIAPLVGDPQATVKTIEGYTEIIPLVFSEGPTFMSLPDAWTPARLQTMRVDARPDAALIKGM